MAGYQKKSSKNARLIALGFAAFILIYLFGQLWGFANLKLRTEQVDEDTIYDFVRAQERCSAASSSSNRSAPAASWSTTAPTATRWR